MGVDVKTFNGRELPLFQSQLKKPMKKIVLIKWSVALIALVAIAGLSSCANSTGTRGITHHPHQHTVN